MESRPRNHLLWIGPLVSLAAMASYFMIFARYPALRDFPWLNLPLTLFGVFLSVVAVFRPYFGSEGHRGKLLGPVGLLLSLLIAGFFTLYVFVFSYQLPGMTRIAAEMARAPDFTLADQQGRPVSLSSYRGRNVVIVFYRGHW